YGLGPTLADFVLAHSGIELTVVFVAGGAGLRLGHALLAPGFVPRRVALQRAAAESVRLALGCVPLLAVAGLPEGFGPPAAPACSRASSRRARCRAGRSSRSAPPRRCCSTPICC